MLTLREISLALDLATLTSELSLTTMCLIEQGTACEKIQHPLTFTPTYPGLTYSNQPKAPSISKKVAIQ